MEPTSSLPHSRKPTSCPYPQPDQFSPHTISCFFQIHCILFSHLLLLPGAELSLITERFALLNDLLLPFLSILDQAVQFFIFIWQMSCLMLSSHLYLGFPCDLLVRGFQLNIFLTVLVSDILCTWPNQLLFSHLRLGFPSGLLASGVPTKTLYGWGPVLHVPPISSSSIWSLK